MSLSEANFSTKFIQSKYKCGRISLSDKQVKKRCKLQIDNINQENCWFLLAELNKNYKFNGNIQEQFCLLV